MRIRLLSLVLLLVAAACMSSGNNDDSTDGGTDRHGGADCGCARLDAGPPPGQPPAPGPEIAPDGTGSVTFAITKLYLGDTDRDGTPNPSDGWQQYGYNIDQLVTTEDSTKVCTPRDNASPRNLIDGYDGIDNGYGKNILPITLGIASDTGAKINDAIHAGKMTTLFELQKLGSGANYNPIMARVYAGADMGTVPKFDGTDMWPVTAESLSNPNDITSAKEGFSQGYVVGNTWVSGKGDLSISLSPDGKGVPYVLHDAVITMEFDESHKNAVYGTISGVISTQEIATSFAHEAQMFDPSFCDPQNPTLASIITQIEQASDIMQDGTQDPSKVCDGISIGLGFEASVVQLGGIATPVPPPADPCSP